MRPLWASSILRASWKSSTIGRCPICEAGRTVGNGCAPLFVSVDSWGRRINPRGAAYGGVRQVRGGWPVAEGAWRFVP